MPSSTVNARPVIHRALMPGAGKHVDFMVVFLALGQSRKAQYGGVLLQQSAVICVSPQAPVP